MANDPDSASYEWADLQRLDDAVVWRRSAENASLANVWHLETVADLAKAIRALLVQREGDERLVRLLWEHIPGDSRVEIERIVESNDGGYRGASSRLAQILNARR